MILSEQQTITENTEAGVWGDTTLDALFCKTVREFPDRLAVVDPPDKQAFCGSAPRRLNFGELDGAVDRLAATFARLGLRPDDVVIVQLPNTVELIVTLLAAIRAGLIVSPVPLQWRRPEMLEALPAVAPRAFVTRASVNGHEHGEQARQVCSEIMSVRFVFGFGQGLPDGIIPLDAVFESEGDPFVPDLLSVSLSANDIATVCWAGGAMGRPAPVPRSHNQWIAAGLMVMLEAGLARGSTLLNPYPLNSLADIGGLFVTWLLCGGTLVQHHALDMEVLLQQLHAEHVAYTALPPPLLKTLIGSEPFSRICEPGHLRAIGCMWRDPVLAHDYGDLGSASGPAVVDVRCLEEMALTARIRADGVQPGLIPHGDWRAPNGAPGGPVLLQARVKGGTRSNAEKESLLSGELMIKSPMMFDRYFPSVRSDTDPGQLVRDARGYCTTSLECKLVGDGEPMIACVSRGPDVLYHGGVCLSARELDSLYCSFDGLADAAAFTCPDPHLGSRILAAVVPSPGHTITYGDFVDFLRQRDVAPYKIPDRLVTVKTIPRDDAGRVLREEVLTLV